MSATLPIDPALRLAGPYTASAGQTAFVFPFPTLSDRDVLVEVAPALAPDTWTVASLTTDYSVTGMGSPGGVTVLFSVGRTFGSRVRITGLAVIESQTAATPANSINTAMIDRWFDRVTIWAQELRRDVASLQLRTTALEAAVAILQEQTALLITQVATLFETTAAHAARLLNLENITTTLTSNVATLFETTAAHAARLLNLENITTGLTNLLSTVVNTLTATRNDLDELTERVGELDATPAAEAAFASAALAAEYAAAANLSLEQAQQALANGAVSYLTRAELYADLDRPAGTAGQVLADGAFTGTYVKFGASGAGGWSFLTSATIPGLGELIRRGEDASSAVTLTGPTRIMGPPTGSEDSPRYRGFSIIGKLQELFFHISEQGWVRTYGGEDLEEAIPPGTEDQKRHRGATQTLANRVLSAFDRNTGALKVYGLTDMSAADPSGAEDLQRYPFSVDFPNGSPLRYVRGADGLDIDLTQTSAAAIVDKGGAGATVTNGAYAIDVVKDVDGRSQLVSYNLGSGRRVALTSVGDNASPQIDADDRVLYRHRPVGSTAWEKRWIAADGSADGPIAPAGTQFWCWGDSLTQGAGGTPWPTQAAALLPGYTFPNRGIGGQTSPQIAARMAPLAGLTVSGNQIPASGAVNVTALTINLLYTPTATARTQTGNLAGVPSTLSKSSGGAYTFTRTTAGSVVACPPGTIWVSDDGVTTQTAQGAIIWVGRNDIYSGGADIEASIASMVAYLRTYVRHVLILGVTDEGGGGEAAGTTNHTLIVNTNAASAAAYGDAFLDIRRYLIDHGLADAGITPTSQDLLDIAADNIPTSLRAGGGDLLHLNTAGYAVVAARVVNHINTRGWLL